MTDRSDEQQASDDTAGFADDGASEAQTGGGAATDAEIPAVSRAGSDAAATELQALRERYLRLAAEYDNYRKRTEKERVESWGRAQAQLVHQLLDALDDLQRVAHFTTETVSAQALLEGVRMVERKLTRVLESAGLEVLDASGQAFDPAVHEAIVTAAAEREEDDDSVGEVFQKGYRFKGDLLRPARVQVRKFGV
ncbi:MAG: nucleotide exchange factor GrpE [Gemmatimonadetes bacterium]|nr:nucleotide exchange factor GrpE [Gemmatimonadota bacterium]